MNWEEVTKDQDIIKNNILKKSDFIEREIPFDNILNLIKTYTKEEITYALGNLGLRLKEFTTDIDSSHPGLLEIYNGQLHKEEDGSFNKDALDLLRISSFAINSHISYNILNNIKKIIKVNPLWTELNNEMGHPFKTKKHIRFLSCSGQRKLIRCQEEATEIDYDLKYWEEQKPDFKYFYRFENDYLSFLEEEKKYDHFQKMGLNQIASKIKKNILNLQTENQKKTYFGFSKISYSQAALILAKLIGFEKIANKLEIDASNYSHPYLHKLKILSYAPKSYQINNFSIPEVVSNIINHLEKFPELKNKSAFDNYKVVVPTVKITFHENDELFYKGQRKLCMEYDQQLLNQKLPAIVVGEKDKETFFICYWK